MLCLEFILVVKMYMFDSKRYMMNRVIFFYYKYIFKENGVCIYVCYNVCIMCYFFLRKKKFVSNGLFFMRC